MSHENYPHPVMAFVGLFLTIFGAIIGESNLPFKEFLQYTAWICGILAAIGSMFKINYRKLILQIIRKII